MGSLVALKYRTKLFLKFFDHTYVQCGTGAVRWKCWGGDTGGTQFRSAPGSTIRAGKIAGNGKANIRCYLINGVCHQAANRILSSANATVQGARGYWVSTALYGVYGRPFGVGNTCPSPFEQYPQVNGDMPECLSPTAEAADRRPPGDEDSSPEHQAFLGKMQELYSSAGEKFANDIDAVIGFQLAMFLYMTSYRLGDEFVSSSRWRPLVALRDSVERARIPLDLAMCHREIDPDTFVRAYNNLAVGFQENVQELLGSHLYTRLFDLEADDTVEIGDPKIAREAYGKAEPPERGETPG